MKRNFALLFHRSIDSLFHRFIVYIQRHFEITHLKKRGEAKNVWHFSKCMTYFFVFVSSVHAWILQAFLLLMEVRYWFTSHLKFAQRADLRGGGATLISFLLDNFKQNEIERNKTHTQVIINKQTQQIKRKDRDGFANLFSQDFCSGCVTTTIYVIPVVAMKLFDASSTLPPLSFPVLYIFYIEPILSQHYPINRCLFEVLCNQ